MKTAENTARDVQIAIANQLAVVCDHVGADITLVRDHVNRLWRTEPLILEPGPGVGGYCVPKDPWLLVSSLPPTASTALVRGAREVNDSMPEHVAAIARRALERAGAPLADARVAVLGLTYNGDSDDVRNAPGPRIVRALERSCAEIVTHDPLVAPGQGALATLAGVDLAILVVAHTEYRALDLEAASRTVRRACLLDCRQVVDRGLAEAVGFTYYGIGAASLA
ncbi:MAG: hypothetical protein HY553_10090 [Elusimicrobia bacterium]|nr:hypothetical protein [Elusimicrobiota bacterium]